ncbi:MAG TPA: response regulator [Sulfurovum sp.]|nr:response regulator [Sulfurovum sp.]
MELSYNVLIVDDVVDNIQIAMNILREENYNLTFALSGEEAITLANTNQFDIILLDIMMPNIDGFTVCERIKKIPEYVNVPIIFLTAKTDIDSISRAFEIGGSDYVTKPFHAVELLARVKSHLELYRSRLILQENNLSLQIKMKYEKKRLLNEVEEGQKELIYTLTELMETCSAETGEHIKRVAKMAHILAKHYPLLTDADADTIFHAAPMHDIGKATIPHHILHKTEKLTDEEFAVMKTHTTVAHKFLKNSKRKMIQAADIIAMQHHERWDGSGYPKGLKGEEIHPYGRVMAVIDVFDALTHKRCYKEAWSIEDSVAYMQEHSGTRFDPQLIDVFMENIDEFVSIART